MNNFKKLALASLAVAAFGTAQANTGSAVVNWTGLMPGSNADGLVITGVAGSLDIPNGTITAEEDGTFTSSSVILESHLNDGDATTPVVGALTAATWSVSSKTLAYGGTFDPTLGANIEVIADGVAVADEADLVAGQAETISLAVQSTTPTDVATPGDAVQATLTVVASTL